MRERNRYRLIFFSMQVAANSFYSFLSLYLKNSGYSGTELGFVLSLIPLIIGLSLPFLGYFDAGSKSRKILVVVCSVIMIAAEWGIIGTQKLAVVAILVVIFSMARAPITISVENAVTLYSVENKIEYSSFRSWSSFGYLVAVFVGGYIFEAFGFMWIALFSTLAYGLLISEWLIIKPLKLDGMPKKEKEYDLKLLAKNRAYIMFIIYIILAYSMLVLSNSYDSLYQNSRGMKASSFGLTNCIRIFFEIAALTFLSKKRFTYKKLMAVAPSFILLQSVLYFFQTPVISIYFIAAFAGFGSGMIIYCVNKYLTMIVRPQNITIGIYIYMMVSNLTTALFTFFGGLIIDYRGIRYVYLCTAALLLAASVFAVFFLKNENKVSFIPAAEKAA